MYKDPANAMADWLSTLHDNGVKRLYDLSENSGPIVNFFTKTWSKWCEMPKRVLGIIRMIREWLDRRSIVLTTNLRVKQRPMSWCGRLINLFIDFMPVLSRGNGIIQNTGTYKQNTGANDPSLLCSSRGVDHWKGECYVKRIAMGLKLAKSN